MASSPASFWLNHSAFLHPEFGSPEIVTAVSDRIAFLLRQPTTSTWFSHFPAVIAVDLTDVEKQLSLFDPAWLEAGDRCTSPPSYWPNCTAAYSSIKVIPQRLVLEDTRPVPLFVYGLLNGQWVLAYSPTFILEQEPQVNRNCPVTLTSSNPAVVDFVKNSLTGSVVPVAVGAGTATIQATVQGFTGSIPPVPVTVTGVGN